MESRLGRVAPEIGWGKYLPLPWEMLLLHTNPFVNTAHIVSRKHREMSSLCGENSTVCLFPQIRQFCAPHSLAHGGQLAISGWTQTFPPGTLSALAYVEQKPSSFIAISRTDLRLFQVL